MDGLDLDAGPWSDGDARAGTSEDSSHGMHDERGGAVDGRHDASERDDHRRGERFGSDLAELCERSDTDVQRADSRGEVHDHAGGRECNDTVSNAVKGQKKGRVT